MNEVDDFDDFEMRSSETFIGNVFISTFIFLHKINLMALNLVGMKVE